MDFLITTGAGEVKMMTFLTGNGHKLDLFLQCLPSLLVFLPVLGYSARIDPQEECSSHPAQILRCALL